VQHPAVPTDEFEREALLRFEKEALGLYVSSHPLHGLREQLRNEVDAPVGQLGDSLDGSVLWTGGIISNLQRKSTKSGGVMLVFRLEDVDGGCEAVAFQTVYEQHKDLLVEDEIVKIKGRLDRKSEDDIKLIVLEVRPFGGVSESRPLTVTVDAAQLQAGVLDDLKQILADFPGEVPVVLRMVTGEKLARLRIGDAFRVAPAPGLYAELKALLGESCIGVSR
jgi:DNA polymerase-3 subunit alpha